jgi:hypothetical protein
MALPSIIFFCALLGAASMLGYRMWRLRGAEHGDDTPIDTGWTHLSVETIRTRLVEALRTASHHVLVEILRRWIQFAAFLKKTDREIREKLMHLLHKNGHSSIQGVPPSHFLKRIAEHKEVVRENMGSESIEQ